MGYTQRELERRVGCVERDSSKILRVLDLTSESRVYPCSRKLPLKLRHIGAEPITACESSLICRAISEMNV